MKLYCENYNQGEGNYYNEFKCGGKHNNWSDGEWLDNGYYQLKCNDCGKEMLTQYDLFNLNIKKINENS